MDLSVIDIWWLDSEIKELKAQYALLLQKYPGSAPRALYWRITELEKVKQHIKIIKT